LNKATMLLLRFMGYWRSCKTRTVENKLQSKDMYIVYFDSGTTNTRAYLIRDLKVLGMIKGSIGSRDSSIAGNNLILIEGLKKVYDELLHKYGIFDSQVSRVFASGMVTSPFGIKEVPHISTPVSAKKLFESIYFHYESHFFHREFRLIRGVKTISESFKADISSISEVNNMRGEEIEVFGVIPNLPTDWQKSNIAIFLPGSHTHIAYVKNKELFDIWSTFSGELFHAISSGTILSGSVFSENYEIEPQFVLIGFENLGKFGLNRALYLCHAMKIFDVADNSKRKSYLEGIIAGGIISGFKDLVVSKWEQVQRIVIAGDRKFTQIYEILLKEAMPDCVTLIIPADDLNSFAVQGLINLLKITI